MPLFECDPVELNEFLTVNPVPVIRLDTDNCLISLYEIETHNGIYRRTYGIGRSYSYNIILKDEKKLVDIDMQFYILENKSKGTDFLSRNQINQRSPGLQGPGLLWFYYAGTPRRGKACLAPTSYRVTAAFRRKAAPSVTM
jgi:hypothetical protein